MTESANDLLDYYARLLIMQYGGKPKADSTIRLLTALMVMPQKSVQQIIFPLVPTAGAFTLAYGANSTASINWNDNLATIQTRLQAVPGLSSVTVTGSIASGTLTVLFTGVTAPAALLTTGVNTLTASGAPVIPTFTETDVTLPIAVQNGFNLLGTDTAVGAQLDILGKYVGVERTGLGSISGITLTDADFLSLIRFAIVSNSSQSDLASIQALIYRFFPGQVFVFDYQNMRMSYLISSSIGSQDLVQVLVSQNLLPRPMTVELGVIYAPVVNTFFQFRSYAHAGVNGSPFNTYGSYQTNRPWLSFANSVSVS